jgi:undecaprenyl-diphosphatase
VIAWLQAADVAALRFINGTLSHPVFDALVWLVSQKWLAVPLFVVPVAFIIWRGGPRKWMFLLSLAVVMATCDSLVINYLKKAIDRPRPARTVEGLQLRLGKGQAKSMPSAHVANWFAVATVCGLFYRRSWWILGPAAVAVAFSRAYAGVHYPSDVVVGAAIGAVWAILGVRLATALSARAMPLFQSPPQSAPPHSSPKPP